MIRGLVQKLSVASLTATNWTGAGSYNLVLLETKGFIAHLRGSLGGNQNALSLGCEGQEGIAELMVGESGGLVQ